MDNSTSWSSEGIGLVKSMEEKKSLVNSNRVEKPKALNCPRCDSSNTKFCYYNNYNLSQPRYFCKTCRRYWTAGGTLRNVPVGGGSRKINKRSSKTTTNHRDHIMMPQPPPSLSNMVLQSPNEDQHIIPNTNIMNGDQGHLIGFFKNGNNNDYAKGMMMMNSFMPSNTMMMTMMMNNSPNGFENDHDDQDNTKVVSATTTTTTAPSTSARMFFPLDDLKPTPTSENEAQLGDSNCNAYWSGGGSAW